MKFDWQPFNECVLVPSAQCGGAGDAVLFLEPPSQELQVPDAEGDVKAQQAQFMCPICSGVYGPD